MHYIDQLIITCVTCLMLTVVSTRRLYQCAYMKYQSIEHIQTNLGCKFATFMDIHSVAECAIFCKGRQCIYFSISDNHECVLCEKNTGLHSLDAPHVFGITLSTFIYINDLGKIFEYFCIPEKVYAA